MEIESTNLRTVVRRSSPETHRTVCVTCAHAVTPVQKKLNFMFSLDICRKRLDDPLTSIKGIDTGSLSPYDATLHCQLSRANRAARMLKCAHLPIPCIWTPYVRGWYEGTSYRKTFTGSLRLMQVCWKRGLRTRMLCMADFFTEQTNWLKMKTKSVLITWKSDK